MLFSKWENSCFHLHIKDCILSMKDLIIKIYCMHSQVGCGLKLSYFHKITLHCFENWTAAYTKQVFIKSPFPHTLPQWDMGKHLKQITEEKTMIRVTFHLRGEHERGEGIAHKFQTWLNITISSVWLDMITW